MSTSHIVYSSFFSRYDIVKHVSLLQGKNLLIDALRELFRNDTVFPFRTDEFGFPLVPDHTGLPLEEAGLGIDANTLQPIINPSPNLSVDSAMSTKILITDVFRQDVMFYPVITVKHTGGNYMPISFNQNAYTLHYRNEFVKDGYGNTFQVRTPTHYVYSGAWEQTFEIKIVALSPTDREELVDIVSIGLQHVMRDGLLKAGLFVKRINFNGEAEEDYVNDHLYTYSISLSTYSEWSREVPVRSVVERINFYLDVLRSGIVPSGTIDGDPALTNNLSDGATLIAIL